MGEAIISHEEKDGGVRLNHWIGFTLSGLVGFCAALVTITLSYSSVSHTAAAAHQRANDNANDIDDDLRPRLRSLEEQRAADAEWKLGVSRSLERIEEALAKHKDR